MKTYLIRHGQVCGEIDLPETMAIDHDRLAARGEAQARTEREAFDEDTGAIRREVGIMAYPSLFEAPAGCVLVAGEAGPGWLWNEEDGFTPPPAPPEPVPPAVSARQFFQALALREVITQAEALDAVRTGAIPSAILAVIEQIGDARERFAAEMLISGATAFECDHPLTLTLAAGLGWSDEEIDDLWRAAAAL